MPERHTREFMATPLQFGSCRVGALPPHAVNAWFELDNVFAFPTLVFPPPFASYYRVIGTRFQAYTDREREPARPLSMRFQLVVVWPTGQAPPLRVWVGARNDVSNPEYVNLPIALRYGPPLLAEYDPPAYSSALGGAQSNWAQVGYDDGSSWVLGWPPEVPNRPTGWPSIEATMPPPGHDSAWMHLDLSMNPLARLHDTRWDGVVSLSIQVERGTPVPLTALGLTYLYGPQILWITELDFWTGVADRKGRVWEDGRTRAVRDGRTGMPIRSTDAVEDGDTGVYTLLDHRDPEKEEADYEGAPTEGAADYEVPER